MIGVIWKVLDEKCSRVRNLGALIIWD